VIARLHTVGQVIERNYEGQQAHFKVRIPPHLHPEFAEYIVDSPDSQVAKNGASPASAEPTAN
jgi:hypothetical protein